MKIIEALKELPLLEKRIIKNCEAIKQYSSGLSTENLPYGTPQAQADKVKQLVQANRDLITRYEKLQLQLHETNNKVKVTIDGETKTINEWITFRRKTGMLLQLTLSSLSTDKGAIELKALKNVTDITALPQVLRFYNEDDKNKDLSRIQDIKDQIDGTLEIVNATTDLVE